jgi:putative nucleotidyltransferase with HDIG domain
LVSVISGVRSLAAVLGADADLLEAAAWLHDIGYTADLATTGLHALVGAATCATLSTPTPCCADWSHTTLAPSSRPANADSPTSFLEFQPTP